MRVDPNAPAFPSEHHPQCNEEFENGMSLRTYAAIQIAAGYASQGFHSTQIAKLAIEQTDWLFAVLNKEAADAS